MMEIKKLSNIKDDSDVMKVWNDLHEYCSDKNQVIFPLRNLKKIQKR